MIYIPRRTQGRLAKLLAARQVLIVLGAHQVGKTVLVERALANQPAQFLNLDNESDRQRFLAVSALAPREALVSLGSPRLLVIDAAQRLPQTGCIVRKWWDARVGTKVVLLGSSACDLLDPAAEGLLECSDKLFLPPLTFREIVSTQPWYTTRYPTEQLQTLFAPQIRTLLMQSLVFGNYPAVVTSTEKTQCLLGLASERLLQDVLRPTLVKSPVTLHDLLRLLAHRIGTEIAVNELSATLGIARVTVERYLELLEQTFIIFRLPAFSTDPRKEICKSQRVFFWDTGIRNMLLDQMQVSPLRADIERLWENWVIAELAKQDLQMEAHREFYFWRSRAGSEVGLVIRERDVLRAYEIKWSRTRAVTRAFSDRYQVPVESIDSNRPLVEL